MPTREYYRKRNREIRKAYRALRRQGVSSSYAVFVIAERLNGMLSADRIRKIVYMMEKGKSTADTNKTDKNVEKRSNE